MSGMSGMSGMGNSTGTTQAGQFIGANTGQTAFIGGGQLGQAQGMQGMQGMMGGNNQYRMNSGQFGQGGQFGRGGNQMGQMSGQGGYGNQNNSNQTQLLVIRRPDIELQNAKNSSSNEISSGLNRLLKRTVKINSPSPVEASFQGNTLVLKGVVATTRDREVAGLLARMEPGVDQVQNDLVVKNSDSTDSKDSSPH